MVNVSGIDFESIVDGCGVRVVIFFSGCEHNCFGCHNPATHSYDNGQEFTGDLQKQVIHYIKDTPFISGVTLSGGDPMYSAAHILPFVKKFKRLVPNKTIWIYSGFVFEQIKENTEMYELLKLCDVIVDGLFVVEERDTITPYVGSSNQRIIDVQQSIKRGEPVLYSF